MANKITAPHSYDPGKGRPKEYLAYLNEREMAYLRSINGNNMERGPRGLPSFPPEDAVGSSSKAGSRGPGGPSGPNSGPSTGGGGKGPGGPSGPNSGPSGGLGGGSKGSAGSSPSSPGGLRGAGGNYGPGSGRPGTTSSPGGYKGPSSPMGGQGPSYSNDTKAQQDAQVRDAIKAVKNSPAFRNDASSGGIRTLSVGPIGTPVNVGPRVSPTAPQKQFYERIAPGTSPSTSISSQFPSYKYDSPLKPGMSPEDMARRAAVMNQIEQEMRDMGLINRPAVNRTGSPIDAGGIPTGGRSPSKTRGFSLASPAEAAIPGPEEKVLEVEDFYRGRPTWSAGTYTSPYDAPSTAKNSKLFDDRLITNNGITKEATSEQINQMTPEDQKKLADSLQTPTYSPQKPTFNDFRIGKNPGSGLGGIDYLSGERTSYTPGDYDAYRNDGSVVDGTDFQNEGTAPSQDPGTPAPGENPALGPAYPEDNFIEKGLKKAGIWGKLYAGADWAAKKNFDKMTLAEQREEMARWQQLKENTRRNVQGKNNRVGGSTSTTSPGGGITDIGSGGKNEPPRIEQAEKEATKPKPKPKEDGPRPAIYYKWDLGVDVPSPTDSDYTLYTKYLQEKAAAKAGMAR